MGTCTRREFGLAVSASLSTAGLAATAAAQDEGPAGSLTDVGGVRVGHFTDTRRPTGCTAILFDEPATAGADYDGSAPGESMGVMLQPVSPLERIHGILLTGGGPMGLSATAGVVDFLERSGRGYDWGVPNVRIPIVVGAVIDDLSLGDGRLRPDAESAQRACEAATAGPVAEGSVGAGAGATVGKMFRSRGIGGMKGGIGTVALRGGDIVVAALSVVNAAGDVLDWRTGRIVAGARRDDGTFVDSGALLLADLDTRSRADRRLDDEPFRATTLTVIATNAALDKTSLTKLAMMANTGASRAVRPYHTQGDGDQVIAVSTGRVKAGVSLTALGAVAADAAAAAIVRGVRRATGVPGWPGLADPR
jgi:L-aminopeptidase/D-esterase-like protein